MFKKIMLLVLFAPMLNGMQNNPLDFKPLHASCTIVDLYREANTLWQTAQTDPLARAHIGNTMLDMLEQKKALIDLELNTIHATTSNTGMCALFVNALLCGTLDLFLHSTTRAKGESIANYQMLNNLVYTIKTTIPSTQQKSKTE